MQIAGRRTPTGHSVPPTANRLPPSKMKTAKQAHDDDDRGCSLALDAGGSGEETTSSAGSRISLDLSLSTSSN